MAEGSVTMEPGERKATGSMKDEFMRAAAGSKNESEAMAQAIEQGGSATVQDPGNTEWEYKKNKDGTIEIIGAPGGNKSAVGMVLKKGDQFYDAIDSVFTDYATHENAAAKAADKPVDSSETAPVASTKTNSGGDRSSSLMSDADRSGRSEDYVPGGKSGPLVDNVDVRAVANRVAKRNNLRDSE